MSVVSLANRKIAERSERIKTRPTAFYYHSRGLCYKVLGMYRQALADYNKAIELEPLDSFNYVFRGDLYLKMRKYEQALADYDRAIELKPNYYFHYETRGKFYLARGNYACALADCNKVVEFCPNAAHYVERANIFLALGDSAQAQADYRAAIEFEPESAESYYSRGTAYFHLEQYAEALEDFNEYIKLKKNYEPDCYDLRGKCYRALGDNSKAQADFARVNLRGRRLF